MADDQKTLLLTQDMDGEWTVSVVANYDQGKRRASNFSNEPMIQQCVAVPIVLAAMAPMMKDALAGHMDIDALMVKVEAAEETVSPPGACKFCGVPHQPEGLIKCSSCLQYMCPGCNSDQGEAGAEVCKDCYALLADASAELSADLEANTPEAPSANESGPGPATDAAPE